jgi:hypothetical protein
MSIPVTLQTVTTGTNAINLINNNFALITTALQNALSRAGSSPNYMNDTLDMNSNPIINLPSATTNSMPVTYGQFLAASGAIHPVGFVVEEQTATAAQTVFNLTLISYTVGANTLRVFINGVRQYPSSYSETNTTRVTFSAGLEVGDKVLFEVLSLS